MVPGIYDTSTNMFPWIRHSVLGGESRESLWKLRLGADSSDHITVSKGLSINQSMDPFTYACRFADIYCKIGLHPAAASDLASIGLHDLPPAHVDAPVRCGHDTVRHLVRMYGLLYTSDGIGMTQGARARGKPTSHLKYVVNNKGDVVSLEKYYIRQVTDQYEGLNIAIIARHCSEESPAEVLAPEAASEIRYW